MSSTLRYRRLPALGFLFGTALLSVGTVQAFAAPAAAPTVTLPTARTVSPAGTLETLAAFPTGLALSPDGATVLVIAGGPLRQATVQGNTGKGVLVESFDSATGNQVSAVHVGDAFQSLVYSPDGATVYVAGATNDAVHVLSVGTGGALSMGTDITAAGFVSSVALASDGSLWAAEPDKNQVQHFALPAGTSLGTVAAGNPDQLLIDGGTLYVSDWRAADVQAINTATGAARLIPVGAHPTGMALTADHSVLVADANDASLATIAPGASTSTLTDLSQLSEHSDSPDAVAVGPDGRAYVALGQDDAVAVLGPDPHRRGHWLQQGLIPTGWYPSAVAVTPTGAVEILSALGLGHSAAATNPLVNPDPASYGVDGAFLTVGTLSLVPPPDPATLATYTDTATATLHRTATGAPDNPVVLGPKGPIKHIIYITRENKTYDADLGDLTPGPDEAFVEYGQQVTPNLHAIVNRWTDAQNFTYEAVASTTGHMWEDTGTVSDTELRNNEAGPNASWHDPTNYPSSGLLVEQAHNLGLSVRTYNEELAQQSGLLPAADQAPTTLFPNYNLDISDTSREAAWETEFNQFEAHQCTDSSADPTFGDTYGATCSLPSLEYVYLGEDHTTVYDEPGYPSLQAQVADNDYATGKLLDAVSHSPDWDSTAVIIVEDDPQGTGDAVSPYRGIIAVASPYATMGRVDTGQYTLASAVGTIDAILGMPYLTDASLTSPRLDPMFTSEGNCSPYSVDASGVSSFPFTNLAGTAPVADRAHGVLTFSQPDHLNSALAYQATRELLARTHAPGSFAAPGGVRLASTVAAPASTVPCPNQAAVQLPEAGRPVTMLILGAVLIGAALSPGPLRRARARRARTRRLRT